MENFIDIEYITNTINLDHNSSEKIVQIDSIKSKLILLLSSNDIIIYDTKTAKNVQRHFANKIYYIKSTKDKLYLLYPSKLVSINIDSIDELSFIDLKEECYIFSFVENTKLQNIKPYIELIYVTTNNEIKYFNQMNKEPKIKNLYKENSKVEKIIYLNGILLWITDIVLKVFQLSTRKMLIKKQFPELKEKNNMKNNYEINNGILNCNLFNNILTVNLYMTQVLVYHLPSENLVFEPIEVKNIKFKNDSLCVGLWINTSLNKLSILVNEDNMLKLKFMKVNIQKNNYGEEYYFVKTFPCLNCGLNGEYLKFLFSNNNSNIYLYNSMEVFYITLIDKNKKMLKDVKFNDQKNKISNGDLEIIYEAFTKMSINEQYYLLCKMVQSDFDNNTKPELMGNFDIYKFYYLFNCLFSPSNINNPSNSSSNNKNTTNMDNLTYLYNTFILLLLKYKKFDKVYNEIKKKFNLYLSQKTKEKVIEILLRDKLYEVLYQFIYDVNTISITRSLEKIFNVYFQQEDDNFNDKNTDLESHDIQDDDYEPTPTEKIIRKYKEIAFNYAHLYLKNNKFNDALSLFVTINKKQASLNILKNGHPEFFFNYERLYHLFDPNELLTILELIFYKISNQCIIFYQKLFKNCNEQKISLFTIYLIAYDKVKLIINKEIGEKLFTITLNNGKNLPSKLTFNYIDILIKFIDDYNLFDYNKVINDNITQLEKKENHEIYITLLKHTKNYKEIINIFINKVQNPEKCIQFIENNNIEDITKDEIYEYLKTQINNSDNLSSAKKFYFISQFKDDITIQDPNYLQLLSNLTNDKDNLQYILLILEQLKLKKSILDISKTLSQINMKDLLCDKIHTHSGGKIVNFNETMGNNKCLYINCESNHFFHLGDKIIVFNNCQHLFHKECYEKIYPPIIINEKNVREDECPICANYY